MLMPNSSPMRSYVFPEARAEKILGISSMVNFMARRGFNAALNTPARRACSWLRRLVDHSRLSNLLLALFRSWWLTSGRSLGGRKCSATNRWIFFMEECCCVVRLHCKYPSLSLFNLRILPRWNDVNPPLRCTIRSRLRTRPRLLTSYIPSQPITGTHISCMGGILLLFEGDTLWHSLMAGSGIK